MAEEQPARQPNVLKALRGLFCASCGREVLLEEMNDGTARQFAGKVYCPQCLNAKTHSEASKCRKCGAYEMPLFDGKTLLCRKCGAELSTRTGKTAGKSGSSRTALKVCPECNGIVGVGATICGHCGEPLTRAARKAVSRRAFTRPFLAAAFTMALVVAGALVLGAYIFKADPWRETVDLSAVNEQTGKLDAIEGRIGSIEQELSGLKQSAPSEDYVTKKHLDARIRSIEELLKSKSDLNSAKITTVELRLAAIDDAIKELSKRPEPAALTPRNGAARALNAVERMVENAPDKPDRNPPDDRAADKELLARMSRDLDKLRKESHQLVQELRFGEALAVWDSRPEYRAAHWQAGREKQKRTIRAMAKARFENDQAGAEKLAGRGRNDDVIEIYRKAAGYGVPEITRAAEKRMAELRRGAIPAVASPETAKLLRILNNPKSPPHARADAAKTLGAIGDKAAAGILVRALDDTDWYVRVVAAQALAKMKHTAAVPKLVDNLTHIIIPVRERCAQALKDITGQDFGQDAAKWRDWLAANPDILTSTTPDTGPDSKPPAPVPNAFPSQVVVYKPAEHSIGFTLGGGQKLDKGDAVWIYKKGKRLCQVIIEDVGQMHAVGNIKGLQDLTSIAKGDTIMVGVLK